MFFEILLLWLSFSIPCLDMIRGTFLAIFFFVNGFWLLGFICNFSSLMGFRFLLFFRFDHVFSFTKIKILCLLILFYFLEYMQRREDLLKITSQIIDSNELLRGVSFLYFLTISRFWEQILSFSWIFAIHGMLATLSSVFNYVFAVPFFKQAKLQMVWVLIYPSWFCGIVWNRRFKRWLDIMSIWKLEILCWKQGNKR